MIKQRSINSLSNSLPIFAFFLLLTACSASPELTKDNVLYVEYNFNDSSVPPEYHRSFTITVDVEAQTAKVVVDAYGDILKEADTTINDHQVEDLFEFIEDIHVDCQIEQPEPCEGGTSESVFIQTSDTDYTLFLDHCGSHEYPEDCGDVYGLKEYMKSLFPTLDQLLE